MPSIETLLDPAFWFSKDIPDVTTPLGRAAFIVFALMFFVGVYLRFRAGKRVKDDLDRIIKITIIRLLVTMGLIGVFIYFLSFQKVDVLGARFWYPVWLIVTLVWTFFVLRFIKNDIPKRRVRAKEKMEKEKYLPKPNKK